MQEVQQITTPAPPVVKDCMPVRPHPARSRGAAPITGIARIRTVVIDCPDPAALAEFDRQLVGGEVTSGADAWVVLEPEPGRRPAFQQADDNAHRLGPRPSGRSSSTAT